MHQHATLATKADSHLKAEAKVKKRALECRAVRLFIASHAGSTSQEVAIGTGIRSSTPFYKMAGMGIIRFEEDNDIRRWYVVPQ